MKHLPQGPQGWAPSAVLLCSLQPPPLGSAHGRPRLEAPLPKGTPQILQMVCPRRTPVSRADSGTQEPQRALCCRVPSPSRRCPSCSAHGSHCRQLLVDPLLCVSEWELIWYQLGTRSVPALVLPWYYQGSPALCCTVLYRTVYPLSASQGM